MRHYYNMISPHVRLSICFEFFSSGCNIFRNIVREYNNNKFHLSFRFLRGPSITKRLDWAPDGGGVTRREGDRQ